MFAAMPSRRLCRRHLSSSNGRLACRPRGCASPPAGRLRVVVSSCPRTLAPRRRLHHVEPRASGSSLSGVCRPIDPLLGGVVLLANASARKLTGVRAHWQRMTPLPAALYAWASCSAIEPFSLYRAVAVFVGVGASLLRWHHVQLSSNPRFSRRARVPDHRISRVWKRSDGSEDLDEACPLLGPRGPPELRQFALRDRVIKPIVPKVASVSSTSAAVARWCVLFMKSTACDDIAHGVEVRCAGCASARPRAVRLTLQPSSVS